MAVPQTLELCAVDNSKRGWDFQTHLSSPYRLATYLVYKPPVRDGVLGRSKACFSVNTGSA